MTEVDRRKCWIEWIGFLLGPVLCVCGLCFLPNEYPVSLVTSASELEETGVAAVERRPDAVSAEEEAEQVRLDSETGTQRAEFSWAGRVTLSVMAWMAVWWLTEAVHITVTALLPLVLFPLLGAASIQEAAAPYAHHLIFLYFGGFIIAFSMEKWGLGKRIALTSLSVIGTTAPRMVAGFMVVTALLSAFVSNTATTAMMLPIALSAIALLRETESNEPSSARPVDAFASCLLLAIAYSASIGGVATIIGTPPNAFLVGFLADGIARPYRTEISFVRWLPVGVSLVALFLPLAYLVMTRLLFPITGIALRGGREMVRSELAKLGPIQRGEWITATVFLVTVLAWLTRPLLNEITWSWAGRQVQPLAGLTDTVIAMTAAVVLFITPVNVRRREFTMDWQTASRTPWDILLLFGGGLSLAAAVQANGVAEFIGSFTAHVRHVPDLLVVVLVTAAIVFLTELTSNVATTTSLVPVLAALAPGLGINPLRLAIPAAMAASCAFMLPVATPPNAIVFGSGYIRLPQMMRAGMGMNILSILLVPLISEVVARWVFHIE